MGKTSWEARESYNLKSYDSIRLRVKSGEKKEIQKRATKMGKSLNGYICDLIEHDRKNPENSNPDTQATDKPAKI